MKAMMPAMEPSPPNSWVSDDLRLQDLQSLGYDEALQLMAAARRTILGGPAGPSEYSLLVVKV